MTPKEKAYDLVFVKFDFNGYCLSKSQKEQSIDFALKCVDEIIQHLENAYYNDDIIKGAKYYWDEVKQEIIKL